MDKPIMILGAGNLALAAIEIFEENKNVVYGVLDDRKEMQGKEYGDVAVLGTTEDNELFDLMGKKCEAFISTDDNLLKKDFVKRLSKSNKTMPVNAIHKTALISSHAHLGHGNFINQSVILASGSEIGSHNILHSGVSIGLSAKLGSYIQSGQGVVIGDEVVIEDEVFIGTGAVIVPGLTLGKGCRIGAGSVVVENVRSGTTVFGNPAKKVQV